MFIAAHGVEPFTKHTWHALLHYMRFRVLNHRVQGYANMEGTTMSWHSKKAWRIQDEAGRVHDM